MVWDLQSLCEKTNYAIIGNAINRIRLYWNEGGIIRTYDLEGLIITLFAVVHLSILRNSRFSLVSRPMAVEALAIMQVSSANSLGEQSSDFSKLLIKTKNNKRP